MLMFFSARLTNNGANIVVISGEAKQIFFSPLRQDPNTAIINLLWKLEITKRKRNMFNSNAIKIEK